MFKKEKSYGGADVMHATPLTSSLLIKSTSPESSDTKLSTLLQCPDPTVSIWSATTYQYRRHLQYTALPHPGPSISRYQAPKKTEKTNLSQTQLQSPLNNETRLIDTRYHGICILQNSLSLKEASACHSGATGLGYMAHREDVWVSISVDLQCGFD